MPAIISTALRLLLQTVGGMATSLLTGPFIKRLLISGMEFGMNALERKAKSTPEVWDDELARKGQEFLELAKAEWKKQ